MEIFSYVLEGELEHQDSSGAGAVIRPGDVQMMSAGTRITHSEFNHSKTEGVHFLQIWIVPAQRGVVPRYQQAHFSNESKRGRLKLIISPDGQDGSLGAYQDVRVCAGLFDGAGCDALELGQARHAYVHVARGQASINGTGLGEGDGARLRGEPQVRVQSGANAELLLFDLRPHELPRAAG